MAAKETRCGRGLGPDPWPETRFPGVFKDRYPLQEQIAGGVSVYGIVGDEDSWGGGGGVGKLGLSSNGVHTSDLDKG